jgi:4-amino-4-deoxychorismate lyase
MYPLFESIKVVDGQFINLQWHQRRVNKSRSSLIGTSDQLQLSSVLEVPDQYRKGVVKCRVSYGERLGPVLYSNYIKKSVTRLQLVKSPWFDYKAKYENRSILNRLYQLRGTCDDVVISINGRVTDTSYSNILLFDGSTWYTPARPLLEGTQRAKLLSNGVVEEAEVAVSELGDFKKLVLINAMLEFEPEEFVEIGNVRI